MAKAKAPLKGCRPLPGKAAAIISGVEKKAAPFAPAAGAGVATNAAKYKKPADAGNEAAPTVPEAADSDAALAELAGLAPLFPVSEGKRPVLVLASASARRLQILQQIGAVPQHIHAPNIDETPKRGEHPRSLAKRLAREKAEMAKQAVRQVPGLEKALILAADTVVAVGRTILPKAETEEEARDCLRLLSGRTHKVYTAVSLVSARDKIHHRLSESRVRFALLRSKTIAAYLASQEWQGKAGGYAVQGRAGNFILRLVGSYSAIVGLDMAGTYDLLLAQNYPLFEVWQNNPLC